METRITESCLELTIDPAVYSESVLTKCFYWYSANYQVEFNIAANGFFAVSLRQKKETPWNAEALLDQVRQSLIDFKLREIVSRETQSVRELIIAKAFAYAETSQPPRTEVADPVGFVPLQV